MMSDVNPQSTQLKIFGMHQSRNDATRGAREHFRPHRQRVMQLLGKAALHELQFIPHKRPTSQTVPTLAGSLAVLGAGNCNDLDLANLQTLFSHVTLFDLDAAACKYAVTKQLGHTPHDRISVAPPTDVSGIIAALETIESTPANERIDSSQCKQLIQILTEQAGTTSIGSCYYCVLSSCLLSQLIDSAVLALGADDPQLPELIQAIRHQHLLFLINSLLPAGRGILVFDFLSSNTFPNLMQVPETELPKVLEQSIATRNFFSGLNPFVIQHLLKSESVFRSLIDDVRLTPPWRWSIGSKQFAVAAITFRRLG